MSPPPSTDDQLPVGSIVSDRDSTDADPDQAIVVHCPATSCADWEIEGTNQTVADYNPDYSPTNPVRLVVFEPTLNTVSDWRECEPTELWEFVNEHDLQYYAYPAARLERDGHIDSDPITVWFDGACEPVNPGGHGTYGIVVKHGDTLIHEASDYLGDGTTNNVAEYQALIAALTYVHDTLPAAPVTVHGDSQLVIRQLTGEYAVRSERLQPYWREAHQLAAQLNVTFEWVPREQNERADALSQRAYYEQVEQDAIEQRRARATEESMTIESLGADTFCVNENYTVDRAAGTCTCPDYQHRGIPCKHLFAVEQVDDEDV